MKRSRTDKGLGRTQVLVLRLLVDNNAKSARHLAYDWPNLTESSARAAVMRLAYRGLADMAGWDENRRTYCLTERGTEVARALDPEPDFDEAME